MSREMPLPSSVISRNKLQPNLDVIVRAAYDRAVKQIANNDPAESVGRAIESALTVFFGCLQSGLFIIEFKGRETEIEQFSTAIIIGASNALVEFLNQVKQDEEKAKAPSLIIVPK